MLRSGNTTQDLGKPAVGECGPVKPVLISEENLIINNRKRLQELFTKYYIASTEKGMCNPEELIDCLLVSQAFVRSCIYSIYQEVSRLINRIYTTCKAKFYVQLCIDEEAFDILYSQRSIKYQL